MAGKDDRALRLAFMTAAHAYALLGNVNVFSETEKVYNMGWASFGAAGPDANIAHAINTLGPFVRANRHAPPEALYIHARGTVHSNRTPWAVLPLHDAFAYALFVLVLNQTDAEIARLAAAKAEADRAAHPPHPKKPQRDDHAMEGHDGIFDRETYSDPRLSRRKRRPLSLPGKRS